MTEPTSLRYRAPFALRALFAVVGLIAGFAYAINAWQVFGFARHVWQVPLALCFGAAVVADALSLAGLFATYLLRRAPKHVRLYGWMVFLSMTGLSIAAAESFALWRRTPVHSANETANGSMVASAAIVVALALAVHLLIVVTRYAPTLMTVAADASTLPAPDPEPVNLPTVREAAATAAPAIPGPLPDRRPPAPPAARAPRPAAPPATARGEDATTRRDHIAARVIAGTLTKADAAAEGGVKSVRAVELWVASYRERHPDTTPATGRPDLKTPMLGPITAAQTPRINGAAPAVQVPA